MISQNKCYDLLIIHWQVRIKICILYPLLVFIQEAIAVGMEAAIDKDDSVITAYRAHGWCYVRGISPHGVLAELTGTNLHIS